MKTHAKSLALVAVIALWLSSCGGNDDDAAPTTAKASTTSVVASTTSPARCELDSLSLNPSDLVFDDPNLDLATLSYVALEFSGAAPTRDADEGPSSIEFPGDEIALRANSHRFSTPIGGRLVHAYSEESEAADVACALASELSELDVNVYRASFLDG